MAGVFQVNRSRCSARRNRRSSGRASAIGRRAEWPFVHIPGRFLEVEIASVDPERLQRQYGRHSMVRRISCPHWDAGPFGVGRSPLGADEEALRQSHRLPVCDVGGPARSYRPGASDREARAPSSVRVRAPTASCWRFGGPGNLRSLRRLLPRVARAGACAPAAGAARRARHRRLRRVALSLRCRRSVGWTSSTPRSSSPVQRAGPGRQFYSTTDSVADIEALRQAIGAAKLQLMGVSYGAYVAVQYARQFPASTEGLILDSSSVPRASTPTSWTPSGGCRACWPSSARRERCRTATEIRRRSRHADAQAGRGAAARQDPASTARRTRRRSMTSPSCC